MCISSEVLPIFLSVCAPLYNTSIRVKDKFTLYYRMNGFRTPRLNKLVPFSAFLPKRKDVDTNYLRSFIQMKEALWLISFKRRKLNEQNNKIIENFQSQLKVGDLVALVRKQPLGARAGHKLRQKVQPGMFKLCRLYHRTAIIIQYSKAMMFHKDFKQRGGVHRPQYLSVDRHLLKPVKDPAAHMGFKRGGADLDKNN